MIINTTAPIAIEELKKYFLDKSIVYRVDVNNSQLKGQKLLTYISNLDLPIDLILTEENQYDVLSEYLTFGMLIKSTSLEFLTIDVLLEMTGFYKTKTHAKFIEEHKPILESWLYKFQSLAVYNMKTVKDDSFQEFVETFEKDDTDDLTGVNFISLLRHKHAYSLFTNADRSKMKNYTKYFNENMFKGKSLFSYWANPNNPMFLLTFGISQDFDIQEYLAAKHKTIQELSNVSLV